MPLLVAILVVVFSALSGRPESHRIAGTIADMDPGRSLTLVGEQLDPWGLRFTIGATTAVDGDRDALAPGRFVTIAFRSVGDRGSFAERIWVRPSADEHRPFNYTDQTMTNSGRDPFTGRWVFNTARSALSTPAPRSWVLQITASQSDVSHREDIVDADGSEMTVTLHATFDGEYRAVTGSPLMDSITCTRVGPHAIACTGKKAGTVTLTDTLTASPDGEVLTLRYSILNGQQEVARGTGTFERERPQRR